MKMYYETLNNNLMQISNLGLSMSHEIIQIVLFFF